jgi:hypothetical protein
MKQTKAHEMQEARQVPVEHEGGDEVQAELAELHVLLKTNVEDEEILLPLKIFQLHL